jgi:hypothetical protein
VGSYGRGSREAGASALARSIAVRGARVAAGVALALGAASCCWAPAASAKKVTSSLPGQEGTAPRPGPPILYAPLAQAPQLENA